MDKTDIKDIINLLKFDMNNIVKSILLFVMIMYLTINYAKFIPLSLIQEKNLPTGQVATIFQFANPQETVPSFRRCSRKNYMLT